MPAPSASRKNGPSRKRTTSVTGPSALSLVSRAAKEGEQGMVIGVVQSWILVALASLLLYPTMDDPELAYPRAMVDLLPVGLLQRADPDIGTRHAR